MVTPRERPRPTRRRIAGERTRPSGGPAAAPQDPAQAPVEETPASGTPDSAATGDAEMTAGTTGDTRTLGPAKDAQAVPTADEQQAAASERAVEEPSDQRSRKPESRPALPWLGHWLTDRDTSGPPNWVLAVLAGLLVAALALDGFVIWREVSHRQAEEDAARATHSAVVEAPSVAEKAAEAVLSYRYDQLPQDLSQARQYLTDDYAPDYVNTIRRLVSSSAQHLKVTVQAKVLASGVSEAGPQRADVLLFVNQTTTSAAEAPKTALNRVVFTMVPRDGQWKVDEIQAF